MDIEASLTQPQTKPIRLCRSRFQGINAKPATNLSNQRKQLEVIAHQRAAIQTQDQQLSQISLALRRQKLIASEITSEVGKESSQLEALAKQVDKTKTKLDRNVEKVKKV